jgi:hypothetical protein
MKTGDPRQLELFADGARAVASRPRPKPPKLTEADLEAKLDAARAAARDRHPPYEGLAPGGDAQKAGRCRTVASPRSPNALQDAGAPPRGQRRRGIGPTRPAIDEVGMPRNHSPVGTRSSRCPQIVRSTGPAPCGAFSCAEPFQSGLVSPSFTHGSGNDRDGLVRAPGKEGVYFMRTMAAVLTAMLVVSVVDTQAFAAANPDRTYYQGAGSCGGKA